MTSLRSYCLAHRLDVGESELRMEDARLSLRCRAEGVRTSGGPMQGATLYPTRELERWREEREDRLARSGLGPKAMAGSGSGVTG